MADAVQRKSSHGARQDIRNQQFGANLGPVLWPASTRSYEPVGAIVLHARRTAARLAVNLARHGDLRPKCKHYRLTLAPLTIAQKNSDHFPFEH
jgi:hypothetical protein